MLTGRQEKLLNLFKGAIERERGSQGAYREMLPFSDDPESRGSSSDSHSRTSVRGVEHRPDNRLRGLHDHISVLRT